MPLTNDEKPYLLTLPGEIKNKIWDYCLDNQVNFHHNEDGLCREAHLDGADIWSPSDEAVLRNPQLGLLLTCRSIYHEVRNMKFSTVLLFCRWQCANLLAWDAHCRLESVYSDRKWVGPQYAIRLESAPPRHDYFSRGLMHLHLRKGFYGVRGFWMSSPVLQHSPDDFHRTMNPPSCCFHRLEAMDKAFGDQDVCTWKPVQVVRLQEIDREDK